MSSRRLQDMSSRRLEDQQMFAGLVSDYLYFLRHLAVYLLQLFLFTFGRHKF